MFRLTAIYNKKASDTETWQEAV